MSACDRTLKDLQLEYLDLYLIHWPFAFKKQSNESAKHNYDGKVALDDVAIEETWSAMVELYRTGKAKAIGVSNFSIKNLKLLIENPKFQVKPMVNQVELHPYLPQDELIRYCQQHSVVVTAYSPLGSARHQPCLLEDETIQRVARREAITPAQVLIAWAVARNTVVIPRTCKAKRLAENFCPNVKLSDESIKDIAAIKTRHRYIDPILAFGWDCFAED